jgi:hypothetical protein
MTFKGVFNTASGHKKDFAATIAKTLKRFATFRPSTRKSVNCSTTPGPNRSRTSVSDNTSS